MPQAVSEGIQINRSVVRLSREDITDIEVDAFVFCAQPDLVLGAGFGNAIAVRGGPTIQKELEGLGPVAPCDAVVSAAGNLKSKHIIHAVGPRFQEADIEPKLRETVLNSLKRAEELSLERVAFPALGAGYYGIPPDVCATEMLDVIRSYLGGETSIKEVIICVLDTPQYKAFETRMAGLG